MMARLRVLLRELAAYVTVAHNPGGGGDRRRRDHHHCQPSYSSVTSSPRAAALSDGRGYFVQDWVARELTPCLPADRITELLAQVRRAVLVGGGPLRRGSRRPQRALVMSRS